jgi:hypothetical protein
MHIAIASLKSLSPYSQSKNIDKLEHPEKPKESKDAYEERIWRAKAHVTDDGYIEIPPTAFANALMGAARRLQLQIPGKGKTQYTKYFEAGVQVMEPLKLPIKIDEVPRDRLFLNADGRVGGGTRVYRSFPRIQSWAGDVTFYILDDIIPEEIFTKVLRSAGMLVGIGRFRPENRGFYGRFTVTSIRWIEDGDAVLDQAAE